MRRLLIVLAAVAVASPLAAQVRQTPDALREQVVRRFMENFRQQASLTDGQYARFQTLTRQSWEARRELEQRERTLLRALEEQMRPGVAADQDSVTVLIDALLAAQADRAAQARSDQNAYAEFLSPVQRAQLVLAWARLERQINEIIRRRMGEQRRMP